MLSNYTKQKPHSNIPTTNTHMTHIEGCEVNRLEKLSMYIQQTTTGEMSDI